MRKGRALWERLRGESGKTSKKATGKKRPNKYTEANPEKIARKGFPHASFRPTLPSTWIQYALNIGGKGFPGKGPSGAWARALGETDLEMSMDSPSRGEGEGEGGGGREEEEKKKKRKEKATPFRNKIC